MILITGINSGLGKYLFENLPNTIGLNRNNFNEIKNMQFDAIIHCAFNKENDITDYKKYLDDNIFLTLRLKKLSYKKFIYISTVDVYNKTHNMYSQFKKFSETLIDTNDLILRCPMLIGYSMKPNHLTKLKNNIDKLGLSKNSLFNYILMEDLLNFFKNDEHFKYNGIIDFISNDLIKLEDLKKYFNSSTVLGDFIYTNTMDVENPIFKLDEKYNISSFDKIKKYFA